MELPMVHQGVASKSAAPAIICLAIVLSGCSSHTTQPIISSKPTDTSAAWSPDGRWIAYAHFDPDSIAMNGLYVTDTTGTQRTLVASGDPRSIDWSPDSRFIVYDDETGIHLIDQSQGWARTTIRTGGAFPSWSPDGMTIAFDSGQQIWLMSTSGSGLQLVWDASPVVMPDWSDDGQRLVVVEFTQAAPAGELSIIQLSDTSSHAITSNARVDKYPRWSPVGGNIVWEQWGQTSTGSNQPEVWLADTNGAGAQRLIVAHGKPSWHPSGGSVVFSKEASGAIRLFVMNIDGSGLRQITH
jgi:Tol biopolymer transport system component